jgi:2-dehydropantoate 2-reductase
MRFVIYGAGAIGGAIGGRLAQHDHEVVLIARGEHAAALRRVGLHLRSPDDRAVVPVTVAEHPAAVDWRADDAVVLAMKSQDTATALRDLATVAPPAVTVVCAQNGVANERAALRRFEHVVAMCVMLPATHLEPGVVEVASAPVTGLLDVGRYPDGVDGRVEALSAALRASTFESIPRPDVMRWKYTKLLMNLANAVEACCGDARDDAAARELAARARAEGESVYVAAGIDHASAEEDAARRADKLQLRRVDGRRRGGGSSWQSLTRATGSIEADDLNGEIVLLGRLHGVPTPVNAVLQRAANALAHDRRPPGSLDARDLLAQAAT